MKLAIIDLDGVIANNEARFAKAEEARQAFRKEMDIDGVPGTPAARELEKEATDIFWRTAFDPALVELDTVIDGAKEALEALRYQHYYQIVFLTSRPEAMRETTKQWLFENNILFFLPGVMVAALVMKVPAFRYVKTVTWKAGMVQTLAALYGADEVLVVDNEAANIAELQKYAWPNLRCSASLAEAVESVSR